MEKAHFGEFQALCLDTLFQLKAARFGVKNEIPEKHRNTHNHRASVPRRRRAANVRRQNRGSRVLPVCWRNWRRKQAVLPF